jgi:hypothetical protein
MNLEGVIDVKASLEDNHIVVTASGCSTCAECKCCGCDPCTCTVCNCCTCPVEGFLKALKEIDHDATFVAPSNIKCDLKNKRHNKRSDLQKLKKNAPFLVAYGVACVAIGIMVQKQMMA